jgi:hypothetical protein
VLLESRPVIKETRRDMLLHTLAMIFIINLYMDEMIGFGPMLFLLALGILAGAQHIKLLKDIEGLKTCTGFLLTKVDKEKNCLENKKHG